MSVLCCQIPAFLINVTLRHQPSLAQRPLALVGPDERICATSAAGVQTTMTPRQAQAHCPDLLLHPLDLAACQQEQDTFLGTLATWGLPVEPCDWGMAYLDLQDLRDIQPLAAALGRTVRQTMGAALQPSLGWDSGKFTARVAAVRTPVGRMRLVSKADEAAFLTPLPITLLPLPGQALQQLWWLGIRTLGDFAALPGAAVWQRFGQAGKLAHQWAQGRDDRPVYNQVAAAPTVIQVDFDPPTGALARAVASCCQALQPHLDALRHELRGCRRLRLQLGFVTTTRTLDISFVEATTQVQAALTQHLQALVWPDLLETIAITLLETSEATPQQLSLFGDEQAMPSWDKLKTRYGPVFLQGQLLDAAHPVAERRSGWQVL